jgi:hypothetical protein
MNEDNLIPTNQRSESERREMARKGGVASGRSRLRKKHGKELVRAILEMKETDPRIIDEMVRLGLNKTDLTNEVVMHVRQIEKAKRKADTKAYNAVAKAAGYVGEDVSIDINIDNEPPVIIFREPEAPAGE